MPNQKTTMIPKLEITFNDVTGSPWEGQAIARFQGEPGESFPVREGMSSEQREDVRWYIEDYMDFPEGGNEVRAKRIEQELQQYGEALWNELKGPELQAWLGAIQVAGMGRLELRATDHNDEIAFRTPWELIRVGGGTLLHQLGVTVVRRSKANLPSLKVPDAGGGLRILAIVCRPEDAGFLDPRYTPEAILEALEDRPEVSIDFCRPGTLAALIDQLQCAQDDDKPYHIVHFDGHGTTIPHEGGIGALCFEKDDWSLDLVRAPQFGDLMARFHIPLVVLEACRTATKFFAQQTVASALLRQGVETVIAMGHAVHIDMTCALMNGFYGSIARGRPLGEALQAGRNQIYANKHRRTRIIPDAPTVELNDWFVPQLYQRSDDPKMLPKKPAKRKPKPKPVFAGFVEAPRAGFQGRGYELHRLERYLGPQRIVVVHAPGGMGKTALSREAALWWTRTGMFPDGAVFVSLEGALSPQTVVSKVGEALEGIEFHRRKDPEKWLEEQLSKRRMLIVWDNYESVLPAFNSGRPTPPAFAELADKWSAGKSRLLVTSRDAQVGLTASGTPAWPFPLGELSLQEGLLLLVGLLERLGIDRAERARRSWTVELLEPIVKETGGHPLALELLTPQIAKLGPQAVSQEVGDLLAKAKQATAEERNRSIQASLDFSIRHLSEKARAVLPAVGLLAGGCPEIMASRIVGLEETEWSDVREELERTGLLRTEGPFLRAHPVLGDIGNLTPSPALMKRFMNEIAGVCGAFDKLVDSADAKLALAILGGSEVVVRRAIDHAVRAGNTELAVAMVNSLKRFLEQSGRGGEGASLIKNLHDRIGLIDGELTEVVAQLASNAASARASEDPEAAVLDLQKLLNQLRKIKSWDTRTARASTLQDLARIHINYKHEPSRAIAPLQEAIDLCEQAERAGLQAIPNRVAVLGDLVLAYLDLRRLDEAMTIAEQILALERRKNTPGSLSVTLHQIGEILLAQGRYQEAEIRFRESLDASLEVGNEEGIGLAFQALGAIRDYSGDSEEAFDYFQRAHSAFQKARNRRGERQVLNSLGIIEMKRGNLDSALAWFDRSLQIAEELGDISGQAYARRNRAEVLRLQIETATDIERTRRLLDQAIVEGRQALALHEQLGQPEAIAASHHNLAISLRETGRLEEGEKHAKEALSFRETANDPDTWKTLWILEIIAEARGDATAAAHYRRRKEDSRSAAQGLAGTLSLPQQTLVQLFQLALTARARGDTIEEALTASGAQHDLLAIIEKRDPWLATHLRTLAGGERQPSVAVPQIYQKLVNQVWEAVS
ncbi:tetratricopeptide repeat protein [Thermodesulfobacteriota bacterium]